MTGAEFVERLEQPQRGHDPDGMACSSGAGHSASALGTDRVMTGPEFLAEAHRIVREGTDEELLAFVDAHLPEVEEQLTQEEYEGLLGGPVETAVMLEMMKEDLAEMYPDE